MTSRPPRDAPSGQARTLAAGLATFALRVLAVHLVADLALTVSVITHQDGTAQLEVLHAGPRTPPPARQPPWLPPARALPLATPAGLDDAVTMIRALSRIAATA